VDSFAVEHVCHLLDEISHLRTLVSTIGHLQNEPIVTPSGAVVGEKWTANPAVAMLRKAEDALAKGLSSLGFDPTSRSRLGLNLAKTETKLDQLIKSRQSG
jgi:P27 family predicted phage terminase small subunit